MRFRVVGGKMLSRFLQNPQDFPGGLPSPETAAKLFVRLFPIATLRARTPKRSGKLAASLRLIRRGANVELHGAFYGRFLPEVERTAHVLAKQTSVKVNQALKRG